VKKLWLLSVLALAPTHAHAAFAPSLSETEGAKCQIEAPIAHDESIADRMLDVLIRNFRRAPPVRETGILGLSLGVDEDGGRFEAVFRADCASSRRFMRERLDQMARETADPGLAREFALLKTNLLEVEASPYGGWEKPGFLAETQRKASERSSPQPGGPWRNGP
jgi:hypothetical protein